LVIDGRKYSHIIDPRTGAPVEKTASVTVIAPDAVTADAWATALSVLGAEGLALLPDGGGIEALVISGDEASATGTATAGFPEIREAVALRIERR
jgi:thiamine biosynthesis lipoprotein